MKWNELYKYMNQHLQPEIKPGKMSDYDQTVLTPTDISDVSIR